jgi:hypothetical protein
MIIQVEFEKSDPRNPLNYTRKRKWTITMCAVFFTAISGKLFLHIAFVQLN